MILYEAVVILNERAKIGISIKTIRVEQRVSAQCVIGMM